MSGGDGAILDAILTSHMSQINHWPQNFNCAHVWSQKDGGKIGFLKPDLEILDFFRKSKKPDVVCLFFSRKGLALAQHCMS